jgi:hypothetical protein
MGFSSGILSCNNDCFSFDTSLCRSNGVSGGGGSIYDWPSNPSEIPGAPSVISIAGLKLNFGGFWAGISLAFENLFTQPLEAIKMVGVVARDYTLEMIIFVAIIGLLIALALKKPWQKKRRRKK